jgi:hypothetical protein
MTAKNFTLQNRAVEPVFAGAQKWAKRKPQRDEMGYGGPKIRAQNLSPKSGTCAKKEHAV